MRWTEDSPPFTGCALENAERALLSRTRLRDVDDLTTFWKRTVEMVG